MRRTDGEITEIYERNIDAVWRVCFAHMKNSADAEDAAQSAFFKLIEAAPEFRDAAHEKAWLIVTAGNICKNTLRHWWRKKRADAEEDMPAAPAPERDGDVLAAVLALPQRYKTAVLLYYFEGYKANEIAAFTSEPCATVRSRLSRARKLLRDRLGEDFYE